MTRRRPPTNAEVRHALEQVRLALLLLGTTRHSGACERDPRRTYPMLGLCASCQALDELGVVLARLKDNGGQAVTAPSRTHEKRPDQSERVT